MIAWICKDSDFSNRNEWTRFCQRFQKAGGRFCHSWTSKVLAMNPKIEVIPLGNVIELWHLEVFTPFLGWLNHENLSDDCSSMHFLQTYEQLCSNLRVCVFLSKVRIRISNSSVSPTCSPLDTPSRNNEAGGAHPYDEDYDSWLRCLKPDPEQDIIICLCHANDVCAFQWEHSDFHFSAFRWYR